MTKKLGLAISLVTILMVFVFVQAVIASDIRPANQLDGRGVGEQIRPANQIDLPSDGNGGYEPSEGSSYSSGYGGGSSRNVEMSVGLNSANEVLENATVNSNATGAGSIIVDTRENTLSFDVAYTGLSSNETGAHIHGPATETENAPVLFTLPLGNVKIGFWNYDDEIEDDILSGKTYINIHSLLFPAGEIRGQIKLI